MPCEYDLTYRDQNGNPHYYIITAKRDWLCEIIAEAIDFIKNDKLPPDGIVGLYKINYKLRNAAIRYPDLRPLFMIYTKKLAEYVTKIQTQIWIKT